MKSRTVVGIVIAANCVAACSAYENLMHTASGELEHVVIDDERWASGVVGSAGDALIWVYSDKKGMGEIVRIDEQTLTPLAEFDTGVEGRGFISFPVSNNNREGYFAVVGGRRGAVLGYSPDRNEPSVIWEGPFSGPPKLLYRSSSDSLLLSDQSKIIELSEDGRELSSAVSAYHTDGCTHGRELFLNGYEGLFRVIDGETQRIPGTAGFGRIYSVACTPTSLFAQTIHAKAALIRKYSIDDAGELREQYTRKLPGSPHWLLTAVGETVVAWNSDVNYLFAVDGESTIRYQWPSENRIRYVVQADIGVLVAITRNGYLIPVGASLEGLEASGVPPGD